MQTPINYIVKPHAFCDMFSLHFRAVRGNANTNRDWVAKTHFTVFDKPGRIGGAASVST